MMQDLHTKYLQEMHGSFGIMGFGTQENGSCKASLTLASEC